MDILPPLQLGLLNGWLLLAAYFVGLIVSVLSFPRSTRKKLFLEPQYPRGHPRRLILTVGRIVAVSFVVLTLFAPLRLGTGLFNLGLALYAIGYSVVMLSLDNYKRTPTDDLVTAGPYRYSRNPQWIGLVGVFVGTALAVGGWLHLALLSLLVIAYHSQILLEEGICQSTYGSRYNDYVSRVPRYLFG